MLFGEGRGGRKTHASAQQYLARMPPHHRTPPFTLHTTPTRQITSKLGAVKTILALLEAQSANEAVVQACSSCLTMVVTEADVTKVVERVVDTAEGLEGGEEKVIEKLNKDVTKLGQLMMCGDFSDTIYQVGGGGLGQKRGSAPTRRSMRAWTRTETRADVARLCGDRR